MIDAILAGVLFLLWGWLGVRIAESGWFTTITEEKRNILSSAWFGSLVFYGISALVMVDTCGDIVDLLSIWAMLLVGIAFGIGIGLCILGALFLFLLGINHGWDPFWEGVGTVAPRLKHRIENLIAQGLSHKGKRYLQVCGILIFLGVCGGLGSMPSPHCEATVDSEDTEAEIRAVLQEHAPGLVQEFDGLVE